MAAESCAPARCSTASSQATGSDVVSSPAAMDMRRKRQTRWLCAEAPAQAGHGDRARTPPPRARACPQRRVVPEVRVRVIQVRQELGRLQRQRCALRAGPEGGQSLVGAGASPHSAKAPGRTCHRVCSVTVTLLGSVTDATRSADAQASRSASHLEAAGALWRAIVSDAPSVTRASACLVAHGPHVRLGLRRRRKLGQPAWQSRGSPPGVVRSWGAPSALTGAAYGIPKVAPWLPAEPSVRSRVLSS